MIFFLKQAVRLNNTSNVLKNSLQNTTMFSSKTNTNKQHCHVWMHELSCPLGNVYRKYTTNNDFLKNKFKDVHHVSDIAVSCFSNYASVCQESGSSESTVNAILRDIRTENVRATARSIVFCFIWSIVFWNCLARSSIVFKVPLGNTSIMYVSTNIWRSILFHG